MASNTPRPGLTDPRGHSQNIINTQLNEIQITEVNNLSFIVANDLDSVVKEDFREELGELTLPPQGSTTGVLSFNGATGHVQGVGSFNGATGAVSFLVDGGEFVA
jgi:hypothetical protein